MRNSTIKSVEDALYPHLDDPEFNVKIAQKKEFYDTQYDGTVTDIEEEAERRCKSKFELMSYQMFVKNFLSMQTPYNSLLLYHALGSGKTISAIGIAEEMRSYMKQIGLNKRIMVIAAPNVINNFRLQLFDESKMYQENGLWYIPSSISQSIFDEINPTNLKDMNKQRLISNVNALIKTYYDFKGYIKFANEVSNALKMYPEGTPEGEIRRIKKIQSMFNNHLFIIDEVHNIRSTRDNENLTKNAANYIYMIAKHAKNVRFVLLSATPMYNSYKEIIWLTNLMNVNDRRSEIKSDQIFTRTGEFRTPSSPGEMVGELLLRKKMMGYVSFVRGENPYTFPFRIYQTNPNDDEVDASDPSDPKERRTPPVYMTRLGAVQEKVYRMVHRAMMNKLLERKRGTLPPVPSSEMVQEEGEGEGQGEGQGEITGGSSGNPDDGDEDAGHVKHPWKAPEVDELTDEAYRVDEMVTGHNDYNIVYGGVRTQSEPEVKTTATSTSASASPQDDQIRDRLQTLDSLGYEQLRIPIQALNIVFKEPTSEQQNMEYFVGKQGLDHVVEMTRNKQFNYRSEHAGFFKKDHLDKFSKKMVTMLRCIENSTGIVMIYSEFNFAGIVPMALALEEAGFARASGVRARTKSLFVTPPVKPLANLRYAMITGDHDFSPDNRDELEILNHVDNKYGENIKVVLINKAGAEGLDFKNIRQIHIMEPWFNLSRIEQIIGRGVRNSSHCQLPFKERNVEIYMHATHSLISSDSPAVTELTADMHLYELSFKKAQQIGKVARVLKSMSVDCILNRGQYNFTVEELATIPENRDMKIRTSTSGIDIDYQPGDRPYTAVCDYSDTCTLTCNPDVPRNEELEGLDELGRNQFTYSLDFMNVNRVQIIERIRQLFQVQPYYPADVLVNAIQGGPHTTTTKYPKEQIYYALTYLMQNRNEFLVDSHKRLGHLINRGDIYAFQPVEISDESISIFNRIFPVEYKVPKLHLELPTKFTTEEADQRREEGSVVADSAAETSIANTYATILARIQQDMDTMQQSGPPISKKTDKEWTDYMHARTVLPVLTTDFGMDMDTIRTYMIHHAVDTLPFSSKYLLATHFLTSSSSSSSSTKSDVEEVVRQYMAKNVHRLGDYEYLILADTTNQRVIYRKTDSQWTRGTLADIKNVTKYLIQPKLERLNTLELRKKHLGNVIGFFMIDVAGERLVTPPLFKIKDLTKKSVGENMTKAKKTREFEVLSMILEEVGVSNNINTKQFNQGDLNVIIEMVLRHWNETDLKTRFLSPEQYAMISDIWVDVKKN